MEFNDFQSIWEYRKKANRFELSFSEFNNFFYYCIQHEEHIKNMLNKLTMKQLKEIVVVRSGDTKENAVNTLYEAIIGTFYILPGMFSYTYDFSGKIKDQYKAALIEKVKLQTEEDYLQAKARQEASRAERQKAIDNPETLEDFRIFLQEKGFKALSDQQYKTYIFLLANEEKVKQERFEVKTVAKVDTQGAEMQLKESRHTIKNIPLFVAQLTTRVERDIYQALNLRAKRLGGYYSSYNKGGAIPGFVFETKEAAETFMQNEYVSNADAREAAENKREQNRAETLEEKADRLIEEGNAILNADRLANTHRRARFAENAEAKGQHLLKVAKIMQNLSAGIKAGNIQFLTKVKSITEIEQLNSILIRARWDKAKAENIKSYEINNVAVNDDLIRYVKYPYPTFHGENMLKHIEKVKDAPGRKLAAARLLKSIKAQLKTPDTYLVGFNDLVEDVKTVLFDPYKDYNTYETEWYKEGVKNFERLKRIGLTKPALLKAALFEFITLRSGSLLSKEQETQLKIKEIERSFIGKKIPGFFPTPIELAQTVIDLAEIKPGNTILEPSAGLGHIAELIAAEYPDNSLTLIEYNISLSEALKNKGFDVVNDDFLKYEGGLFDRIIMNPPFENLQDIDHVRHAFNLLKPGGKLVAIMANNKTGERSKVKEFADFIDQYGYFETNPEGSFKSAFNPTGVNTITVVLDKPEEQPETTEELNGIEEAEKLAEKNTFVDKAMDQLDKEATAPGKFSETKEVPITEIFTRPEAFQNRNEKFSQATFDKITAEGYDKTQEPIYVWRDPADGKFYILSGHSRFAAAQFLNNRDHNLKTLPVKEFYGTFDDAIDYATIRSNRESNKEGLKADINAYLRAVSRGYNKTELLKYFNPESYLNKLRDLSYLNPKGKFMEYMDTPQEASFPYLSRNASWVGELKRQYPNLSNSHESEMFDYLYKQGTSKLLLSKEAFTNLVKKKAGSMFFDPEQPLNLANAASTAAAKNPGLEHLNALRADMEARQDIINKNRDLIARARVEGKTDRIKEFESEISGQTARIIELATQIKKAEHDLAALERNTMFDLFTEPAPEPEKQPKAKDEKKNLQELLAGLKLAYEISPDDKTLELIKAIELTLSIL